MLKAKYEKPLSHIFNSYILLGDTTSAEKVPMGSKEGLHMKCFARLMADFRVAPALVSPEELRVLYKHMIRHKEGSHALSFRDFVESLVRVAVLAKDKLGNGPKPRESVDSLEGVNTKVVENLLLYMGIAEGMGRGQLDALVKTARDNGHALPSKQLIEMGKSIDCERGLSHVGCAEGLKKRLGKDAAVGD